MYISYSLVGILVLILDIWVIIKVLQSGEAPTMKLVWIILVLLLPIIGPILYLILSSRV